MERRSAHRLVVNLRAERLSCSKNCSVFIENLSDTGIYMITAPSNNRDYEPGRKLHIKLELATGRTLNLQCNVKWSYDNSPEDLTNSVGLEIINPPDEYRKFVNTLQ
jgi:hypothetical protein